MWNLREYRPKARRLADHLPWAALVAPGVVLNKDGSLQATLAFRGPDLDSSTASELVAARALANNAMRRLGSGWCVHVEAARRSADPYPVGAFPCRAAELFDEERRQHADEAGGGFETDYYLTMTYLLPEQRASRLADWLVERPAAPRRDERGTDYRGNLAAFVSRVRQTADLLASFMPDIRLLDDAETLSYLHACVSDRRYGVAVPEVPFCLDEMLTDSPLACGLSPKLGDRHLRTVSVRAYAGRTVPCLLDGLNALPLEYRWVVRWLPMDKQEATNRLNRLRRQWFAKRKGAWTLLKEAVTKSESGLEDSDSLNKARDVDAALQEVGGDFCSYGQLTLTVTVWDADEEEADRKARRVRHAVDAVGLVSEVETVNAVSAWLGSLPGHAYADVRRPLVSSLNLCDLIPMSSVWPGPSFVPHLQGPALLRAAAKGSTPFRLSLHQGDVGHTLVAGPTGAGKSTLLSAVALQWLRYDRARVVFFDKGGSCRAATWAAGGVYHEVGGDTGEVCFQPLAGVDDEAEAAWAQDWLLDVLGRERVELTPDVRAELWSALATLRGVPRRQRTLSTLHNLVQSSAVRTALRNYTLDGPWGRLLDADRDTMDGGPGGGGGRGADWVVFEMGHLMHARTALVPTLTYLFHRLEKQFDGRPTLLVLDEAWLYLTESTFAAKVREWLKVLRKQNVAVVFATQSLSDVADSPIAPAVVENCLTRIFLPNGSALEERTRKIYESFGLNERQLRVLQQALPKREYYYQSRSGNRLFSLRLGPVGLSLCGASSPEDRALADRALALAGGQVGDEFLNSYLRLRGLDVDLFVQAA